MKRVLVLSWKELKECQWALAAGAAVFVGVPVLLTLVFAPQAGHADFDLALGLVAGLGGAYAVLVGARVSSCDFGSGLEPLWRSRPIGIGPWTAVKYITGASVVLLVTATALIVECVLIERWGTGSIGDQSAMLVGHSCTLLLIYSLAFLLGSVAADPLRASLLSLPAALAVYFLPVLTPALRPWSVIDLAVDWPAPLTGGSSFVHAGNEHGDGLALAIVAAAHWRFILGHAALSLLAGALAWLAVRRRFRIELDQKAVVFALAGAALALLALGAEQVGSNLECKAVHELAPGRRDAVAARVEHLGGKGILARYRLPERHIELWTEISLQSFDLSTSPPRFGTPVRAGGKVRATDGGWGRDLQVAWSPERAGRAYLLVERFASREDEQRTAGTRSAIELTTVDVSPDSTGEVLHRLDLLPELPGSAPGNMGLPQLHLRHGILYVRERGTRPKQRVLRIDTRPEGAPVLLDALELDPAYLHVDEEESPRSVDLPDIPGLDARERLEIALLEANAVADGDLLVSWLRFDRLETFEIDLSAPGEATFTRLGARVGTTLERLLHFRPGAAFLRDGLFFALGSAGMTVYDVRDPTRPRRIGHYASPYEDFRAIAPLPGGDVLVGGRTLHVVAAPEGRARPSRDFGSKERTDDR